MTRIPHRLVDQTLMQVSFVVQCSLWKKLWFLSEHIWRPRISLMGILVVVGLLLGWVDVILAQGPVAVPAVPAQPPTVGGGGVIVRSLWTEIIVTVLMIGVALFAVGRSSNRS